MSTGTIDLSARSTWTPPRVKYSPDGRFRWNGEQWVPLMPAAHLLPASAAAAVEAVERPPAPVAAPVPAPRSKLRLLTTAHLALLLATTVVGGTGVSVSLVGFH